MPLPDFLRRKRSSQVQGSRPDLVDNQAGKVPTFPLENVSEDMFLSSDDSSNLFSLNPGERPNGLAKSFSEVLSNPNGLGYFIQFMDSRGCGSLVKFCLDVQSFQASAKNFFNDRDHYGTFQSAPLQTCDNQPHCDAKRINLRNPTEGRSDDENCNNADENWPTSPSSESIDSGIMVNQSEGTLSPLNLHDDHFLQMPPTDGADSISVNNLDHSQNLTPEEQHLVNQTKDALSIYQRYVAPESPLEIDFPLSVKHSIITGICSESGHLDTSCFDAALNYVTTKVEKEHFGDFINSDFNAKHQVDVLSQDGGRHVNILDILENEVLLFHFMEFLEKSEGRNFSSLLEFWISANNFRQQATAQIQSDNSNDHSGFMQEDAVAIYEKFVSLQAPSPLGFSTAIRSRIEQSICASSGPLQPTCFDEALLLVVRVLHMRYVQKFINSQLFNNYISELMATIASNSDTKLRKFNSSTSLNTSGYSESNVSISCQNTLLASASTLKRHQNVEKPDPNFLDLCSESDHLWRRKQTSITNIGFVDSLGRYRSDFEAPPDVSSISQNQPMGSKISKVVRRIITNSEVERGKEELAWQMAGMIVRDVTSRTATTHQQQI